MCPACKYNHLLWDTLLDLSFDEGEEPTTEYADRVFAALTLEQDIEDGLFTHSDISAREYNDLRTVKNERRKIEGQKNWERAQEAAQQAAKHR
jgi:hypothetical protein